MTAVAQREVYMYDCLEVPKVWLCRTGHYGGEEYVPLKGCDRLHGTHFRNGQASEDDDLDDEQLEPNLATSQSWQRLQKQNYVFEWMGR